MTGNGRCPEGWRSPVVFLIGRGIRAPWSGRNGMFRTSATDRLYRSRHLMITILQKTIKYLNEMV